MSSSEPIPQTRNAVEAGPSTWIWLALVWSLAGLGGSLYLSLGMHLKACPLCFYQRTFMISLCVGLLIGLALKTKFLSLLALPLATGGFGVAGFHVFLEHFGFLECPLGILEAGSAPQQSLALFAVVFGSLLLGSSRALS